MGGWLGALKAVGEGIASQSVLGTAVAENLDPSFQPAQQNQQGLLGAAGRYLKNRRAQTAPGANVPTNYDQNVPGIDPAHMTDPSNPIDPNRYEDPGAQGADSPGGVPVPNQDQWLKPPVTPQFAGAGLAKGATIVSSPTIAKIGEAGPEMVVPLKARAGNRVQPDVLEGHISPPRTPGIRYSRYKTFTDRSL
jgi:hypothetical protein